MRSILTTFTARDFQGQPLPPTDRVERPSARNQTLEDLIASCVRDAFGDTATAAHLLQDRIQSNRKALQELTRPLLSSACLQAVSARIRANRPPEDDWSKDEYEEPDTSERLFALAKSNLDYRLPNGIILRDAFVQDVRDGAAAMRRREARAAKYAAWLEAIAARMPKHRTVGEILDEPTLVALLEES